MTLLCMKKRFSRRHNSLVARVPWLGPVALVLFVLVLICAILRFLLPGVLVSVASPFWSTGSSLAAGVGNVGSFFSDKATLTNERDRLLSENAAYYAKNAALDARVTDLERLLGDRTERVDGILAGVLSRPPVSPYDVLIVDAGAEAGVSIGNRADGPGGMPLGVVESVTNTSSRILLYSTPGNETESWIGETRIPVTLVGEGSGAMSAVVAREAGILVGDLVYTSGPGALPIGSVLAVGNDPSSPRSRVDIRPLLNPFSVTWVTITP